jgi:hypothetical protein
MSGIMKRVLFTALVSLASLASAIPAQAKTFGIFINHCCGGLCGCCGCDFRIRQYNAFSPVCSGCITCDGNMPFGSAYPGFAYGGYYPGAAGCNTGTTTPPAQGKPPAEPAPAPKLPTGPTMIIPPINTTPVLMPHTESYNWPYAGYGVEPVGYYGYAPMMPAYPMNYWNPMGQVPYYWNPTGGR